MHRRVTRRVRDFSEAAQEFESLTGSSVESAAATNAFAPPARGEQADDFRKLVHEVLEARDDTASGGSHTPEYQTFMNVIQSSAVTHTQMAAACANNAQDDHDKTDGPNENASETERGNQAREANISHAQPDQAVHEPKQGNCQSSTFQFEGATSDQSHHTKSRSMKVTGVAVGGRRQNKAQIQRAQAALKDVTEGARTRVQQREQGGIRDFRRDAGTDMECDASEASQEEDMSEENASSMDSDSSSNSYASSGELLHSQIRDMFLEDAPYKMYGDVYETDDEDEQGASAAHHKEWLLKLGKLPVHDKQGEKPTSKVFGMFD
jgi:hypothetical protein